MGDRNRELIKAINQYQHSLDKYSTNLNVSKLLYYIDKLDKMPITVAHLQDTGIGRTVNALRKLEGKVGDVAKALVAKWKDMVIQEGDVEDECDGREEEERDSESSTSTYKRDSTPEKETKKYKHKSSSSHSDSDKKYNKEQENKEKASSSKSDKRKYEKEYLDNKRTSDCGNDNKHHKSKHKKNDCERNESEIKHKTKRKYETSDSDSDDDERKKQKLDSKQKNKYTDNENIKLHDKKHESTSETRKHKSSNDKKLSSDDEVKKYKNNDKKHKSESSKKNEISKEKHVSSNKNEQKSKKDEKVKNSSKHHSDKKEKGKKKLDRSENGIDCGSGASFAEVLGMLEPIKPVFKKKTKTNDEIVVPSTSKIIKSDPSPVPFKESKLEPFKESKLELLEPKIELNISSLLPQITPNYKPLGNLAAAEINQRIAKGLTDEALTRVMSSKNQRTKVYSGNKCGWNKVPTLFEICTRILQDNIDALEYTGGVPYLILKPVLEKATPDQLFMLEHHNPYLIEDTDELWYLHCQKEFRSKQREELESWREMYMRCLDEREAKLKALTANIKQSQDKSLPVRQTKLAYVDNYVKPPRQIAKKQAKNGIIIDKMPAITPTARLNAIASAGSNNQVTVPNPGSRAVERSSGGSSSVKPKKAPLMQKTLALIKSRFRR